MNRLKYEYDQEADAIYIYISDVQYAYGKDLDEDRRIDYDINGQPIGVELLSVSEGVIPDDLPCQNQIEQILTDLNIKIFA